MRRTWVSDSREKPRRRRTSLNVLGLEQLEDKLTLSATAATVFGEVELLSPAAIAPATVAEQVIAPITLQAANDHGTLPDAFTHFNGVESGPFAASLTSLSGNAATDNFTGGDLGTLPDAFTHFDLETLPLGGTLSNADSFGGLSTIGIVAAPAGDRAFGDRAFGDRAFGDRAFGTLPTIGIDTASELSIAGLSRDIDIIRVGNSFRFQPLEFDIGGHPELVVLNGFDHSSFQFDVEVLSNHVMDVIATHAPDADQQMPGLAKPRDTSFQVVFGVRDQWLNQARPDGSTRLQPMTNFAADASVASAGLAGQRAPLGPWVANGPSTVHVVSSERDGAAGTTDLLLGPHDDADQGADSALAARPTGSSGRQGGRYDSGALDVWHKLPLLASLAADYFTTDEAGSFGAQGVQTALLSTLSLNTAALDQALENVTGEIEKLSGDIVGWLDRMRVPPWTVTTVVVAALGGGVLTRCWRNRRSDGTMDDEESSTWLFTRLHSSLG